MAGDSFALVDRVARVTIALPTAGAFGAGADPGQNAVVIDGAELRVAFVVTKSSQKEPNKVEVRVTNLAPATRARLQTRGLRLQLEAGYRGAGLSRLCVCDVRTTEHQRDGADWVTTLRGGDGERSHAFARASESFARGVTVGQVVERLAAAMGLDLGNVSAQASRLDRVLGQGWTAHGSAAQELERVLRAVGYSYSVQDGAVQVLAPGESVGRAIVELSASTGLLGAPELSASEKAGGTASLRFQALLLPQARPGTRVSLRSERYQGIVRLRAVRHSGDTTGGPWQSDCEAVADPTLRLAPS